jgi:hypothetical protein
MVGKTANTNLRISYSYYNNTYPKAIGSNESSLTNVISYTDGQMKQNTNFENFDFGGVWGISETENDGYPYLRGMVVIPNIFAPGIILEPPQEMYGLPRTIALSEDSFAYTGEPICPNLIIGEGLVENRDYVVSYSDNTNVGIATVTIEGIGRYFGFVERDFAITNADAPTGVNRSVDVLKQRVYSFDFDLTSLLPSIDGTLGNVTYLPQITENTDSVLGELSYESGDMLVLPILSSGAGETAEVTVTVSSENYNDFTAKITVVVADTIPLTITGLSVSGKEYDGSTVAPLTGTAALKGVISGDDVSLEGTVTANFENETVGADKSVTISGMSLTGSDTDKYHLVLSGFTANITLNSIYDAMITINGTYIYDGSTHTPATDDVIVVDNGRALIEGTDYTYSLASGGRNAGAAYIEVVGKGGYTDYNYQTFSVTKKEISLDLVNSTVAEKTYDGTNTAIISPVFSGLENEETLSLTADYTIANVKFNTSDVERANTVTATLSLVDNGTIAKNYTLTSGSFSKSASISPTEYTYDMPAVTEATQGLGLSGILDVPSDGIGVNSETVVGTIKWFSDERCANDIDDDDINSISPGNSTTLWYTFVSGNSNYVSTAKTGQVTLLIIANALTGTATIDNTAPKIGDALTASLAEGNNTGALSYVWKAGGAQVGTGATYTVATADLGKTLMVTISSSVETGSVTSAATTAATKKSAPAAPAAPTLASKTHNGVTLTAVTGNEYSKDETSWQDSNEFAGLAASTAHTFYQRVRETADTLASASSAALNVTTDAMPGPGPDPDPTLGDKSALASLVGNLDGIGPGLGVFTEASAGHTRTRWPARTRRWRSMARVRTRWTLRWPRSLPR